MFLPHFCLSFWVRILFVFTLGITAYAWYVRPSLAVGPASSFSALAIQDDSLPEVEVVGGIGGRPSSIVTVGTILYMAEGNKLSILDISNPTQPIMRARAALPSPVFTPYNPSMAIHVIGSLVYVMNNVGLHIVDVSDATHPVLQSSFAIENSAAMQISGSLAYVISRNSGLYIVDVSNAAHPVLQGIFTMPSGLYLQVTGNLAYILKQEIFGSSAAYELFVVDVSNSQQPSLLGYYHSASDATIVTKVAIEGNYVFLTAHPLGRTYSELQIIDIGNASQPILRSSYGLGFLINNFQVVKGIVYATSNDSKGSLLASIVISDPDHPYYLSGYERLGITLSAIHVVDNQAYLTYYSDSGSDNRVELEIVNLNYGFHPTLIGRYARSDIKRGIPSQIVVSDERAYVAYVSDDRWGSSLVEIIDVHDVANPMLAGKYFAPGFIRDIEVGDDAVYIGARDGLHIVDVSNPTLPLLRSSYAITEIRQVVVANNLAYISTVENGMQILDVSNPVSPTRLWSSDPTTCGYTVKRLKVVDHLAYTANSCGWGLSIMNVSNPFNPTLQATFDGTPGPINDIEVQGNLVYLATANTVQIVDTSNPEQPVLHSTYKMNEFGAATHDIEIAGSFAYVTTEDNMLQILDVRDPGNPIFRGRYRLLAITKGVYIIGDFAYGYGAPWPECTRAIACSDERVVEVINVSNPANPIRQDIIFGLGAIQDVQTVNDLIYVGGNGGVEILRVYPERFPSLLYLPFIQRGP